MAWDADKPDMDLETGTDFDAADGFFRGNYEALELALIEYCNFPGSLDYLDDLGLPKARSYDLAGRAALSPIANMWILRSDKRSVDVYASGAWHSFQTAIIGEITLAAFDPVSLPLGWLECNGAAVSGTTYAALFAAIAYAWGNPGGGSFNLPDAQGCVLIGMDDGAGDYDAIAKSGGAGTHQLTAAQLASHEHGVSEGEAHTHFVDGSTSPGSDVVSWHSVSPAGQQTSRVMGLAGDHTHTVDDTAKARDAAHNNKQPYLTLGRLIYAGV